jgi:hypothetical protein
VPQSRLSESTASHSVIYVDAFEDSAAGDCATKGSGSCTLRAALALADGGAAKTVTIFLPASAKHTITYGEMEVAALNTQSRRAVRLVGSGGVAVVDGAYSTERFLSVGPHAAVELVDIRVQNFYSEHKGAAVYNEGRFATYGSHFESNFAKGGGMILNAPSGRTVLRQTSFKATHALHAKDGTTPPIKTHVVGQPGSDLSVEPCPSDAEKSSSKRPLAHAACFAHLSSQSPGQTLEAGFGSPLVVSVNYFTDSADGECAPTSGTCNLRAAVALAAKARAHTTSTTILLSADFTHVLTLGAITVPSGTKVLVRGSGGMAVLHGDSGTRVFAVEAGAKLELADLSVASFAPDDGSAVWNDGELMVYRVAFAETAPQDATLHNTDTLSLWEVSFPAAASGDVFNGDKGRVFVNPCSTDVRVDGAAPRCITADKPAAPGTASASTFWPSNALVLRTDSVLY